MNKNLKNQIQVSLSNLNIIQSILSKSKFELLEIWTPDEGNEKQIWFNKHSDTKITILINSDKSDTDNQELISEVRDSVRITGYKRCYGGILSRARTWY